MAAYRMGSASAEKPESPEIIKLPAQRRIFNLEKIENAIEKSDGMGGLVFLESGFDEGDNMVYCAHRYGDIK